MLYLVAIEINLSTFPFVIRISECHRPGLGNDYSPLQLTLQHDYDEPNNFVLQPFSYLLLIALEKSENIHV